MLDENALWLLSYYRLSEISGALFFGRLSRSLRPSSIQRDMTKHFSEESLHAWYWTDCIVRCGGEPAALGEAYQDQYVNAAGLPVNLMEVLAITHVFEKRVVRQYAAHAKVPGVQPAIASTLHRILQDERWHLEWVRRALADLEPRYGADHIAETIARFEAADREVYDRTIREHADRLAHVLSERKDG